MWESSGWRGRLFLWGCMGGLEAFSLVASQARIGVEFSFMYLLAPGKHPRLVPFMPPCTTVPWLCPVRKVWVTLVLNAVSSMGVGRMLTWVPVWSRIIRVCFFLALSSGAHWLSCYSWVWCGGKKGVKSTKSTEYIHSRKLGFAFLFPVSVAVWL